MKQGLMYIVLAVICCAFFPQSVQGAGKETPSSVVLIVKASPASEYHTEFVVQSPALIKALNKALGEKKAARALQDIPLLDTYLSFSGKDKYGLSEQADLYDLNRKEAIELPTNVKEQMKAYIHQARRAHYGKLIPWEEAKTVIPRYAKVQVMDLETGLQFEVQRRAGNRHADVQPLTKADTEIMKRIYQGEWSWRRRAVIVKKDGQSFAASMHGMPHGGDGIPNNDFRGHFCIHFLGSSTHKSHSIDPDHQWMVYKAAGRWDEAFASASPGNMADSFLTAMNQKDPELLKRAFADQSNPQLAYYLDAMNVFKAIKKNDKQADHQPAICYTCKFQFIPHYMKLGKNRKGRLLSWD